MSSFAPGAAFAGSDPCPALTGADPTYSAAVAAAGTHCNTTITINSTGVLSFAYSNLNPYDGNDDNYVGVINNYAGRIFSIMLTSNTDIFNFDGDGIDSFGIAGNITDLAEYGTGAYGGFDADYSAINPAATVGTVNFLDGLAANGVGATFRWKRLPRMGILLGGRSC